MINSFRKENSFLSNMAKVKISYDNIIYPSVENFYVAMKITKDKIIKIDKKEITIRKYISTLNPYESKKFGKKLILRKDWDNIKLKVMEYALKQKFSNYYYKEKLLFTENKQLIEGNWWGDTFWGVCNNKGENHLGKLLMQIRKELQNIEKLDLKKEYEKYFK